VFDSLILATGTADPDPPSIVAADFVERSGLPAETLTVPEGRDVATTIVEHVRARDGALLVMTTGGAFLLSEARHTVTGEVLERVGQPVLVVGPRCVDPVRLDLSTLVVGVDLTSEPSPAVPVVAAWRKTFGGGRPRLVDVVAEASWPARAADDGVRARLDEVANVFAAGGIDADATVLQTNDPVGALVELGDFADEAIFVLTSDRWPGRSHWYSTTRRVIQESSRPVLVVPSDLAT
jgi:nucleotide-binding universal stress UspA family protein